jgi:hypothetical protein
LGYEECEAVYSIEAVSSFVNGFKRQDATDVINAMYVAKNIFKIEVPFDFQSRGSRGVDSPEIRKILFFSNIKDSRNHKKVTETARQLSKLNSKRLGWLAQYIMNGRTHLYPKEADEAVGIQEELVVCKV